MYWKLFFTIVCAGVCVFFITRLFNAPLAVSKSAKGKIGFGREDETD
ncbi:MAG: hypothetical protein WDN00_00395 [Limisphaerales bacterium]